MYTKWLTAHRTHARVYYCDSEACVARQLRPTAKEANDRSVKRCTAVTNFCTALLIWQRGELLLRATQPLLMCSSDRLCAGCFYNKESKNIYFLHLSSSSLPPAASFVLLSSRSCPINAVRVRVCCGVSCFALDIKFCFFGWFAVCLATAAHQMCRTLS